MTDDGADNAPVVVPIGPELDLHSFLPRDVPSVVDEYVTQAVGAGLARVRIVHGRGRGVQRGAVQAVLERHPHVRAFWDDPDSHLGATVADLAAPESVLGSDPGVRPRGQTPFWTVFAYLHGIMRQ